MTSGGVRGGAGFGGIDRSMVRDWKDPDYRDVIARRGEMFGVLEGMGDEAFRGVMAFYARNPVAWINDWGWTSDPRRAEVGKSVVVPLVLFQRQEELVGWILGLLEKRDDGLIEKSRDMGVTWVCIAVAVWLWMFRAGCVVGFGSRKETLVDQIGDPDSIFWKLRSYVRMLPPRMLPAKWDEKTCAPYMRVINPDTGSVIRGEGGTNIGRGGRATIYFKDESAFYESADTIDAALSQTTNCQIDLSTPNGEGNPFWRKRHEGRVPVFVFDWRDDPRKDKEWYEAQVAKRDRAVVAQEIDRDYSASVTNAYIEGHLVTAAMANGPGDVEAVGPLRFGVDVARFGNDETVLIGRRGRVVVYLKAWAKCDTLASAMRVRNVVRAYMGRGAWVEQIAVDVTGLGAGVADNLRGWKDVADLVVDVVSAATSEDGECYNLRSKMWKSMKEWLENAPVSLPRDQKLRADLTGLRYSYRGGLLLMESKDDAKRRGLKSPDRGDALGCTFAKPGPARQPPRKQGVVVDYGADADMGA